LIEPVRKKNAMVAYGEYKATMAKHPSKISRNEHPAATVAKAPAREESKATSMAKHPPKGEANATTMAKHSLRTVAAKYPPRKPNVVNKASARKDNPNKHCRTDHCEEGCEVHTRTIQKSLEDQPRSKDEGDNHMG
jgi:hypothetical protein